MIDILNSSFTDFPLKKLPPETDFFFKEDPRGRPLGTIQAIVMRMRTSHKLKMQKNIASMSLTIMVGDFQPRN